jgi:hypothetical protein
MRAITPEPREGWEFVEFAKDQPEYLPLPANRGPAPYHAVETKWIPTEVELAKLRAGEAVYLHIYTFGQQLQPVRLEVGRED